MLKPKTVAITKRVSINKCFLGTSLETLLELSHTKKTNKTLTPLAILAKQALRSKFLVTAKGWYLQAL